MDIERAAAEQAARPDRRYSTLRDDYSALRGGQSTGMAARQPAIDGKLYLQIDNPQATIGAPSYIFPG